MVRIELKATRMFTPDASCEVVFQSYEWQALHAFTYQTNVIPSTPPSLNEATRLVAKLGGFLARKSDGEPGVQTIWRGLRRLNDLSSMWLLLHSFPLRKPLIVVGNDKSIVQGNREKIMRFSQKVVILHTFEADM